jgi:hypothetical protein
MHTEIETGSTTEAVTPIPSETTSDTVSEAATGAPAIASPLPSLYLEELDNRVKRSEVVGLITLRKGSAALFYEAAECKFTLVEKLADVEAANVFDCVQRDQWGRTVMLFGHATNTGGYIPSGHATLDGNTLKIKLANGSFYRIDVDATLAHLQPFVSLETPDTRQAAPKPQKRGHLRAQKGNPRNAERAPRPQNTSQSPPQFDRHTNAADVQARNFSDHDDESSDLTEEDLRRLRGEIPLSSPARKKWKR